MYLPEAERASSMEDRRFALKRAADKSHARVEDIVQGAGMFASREGYRRYLAATFLMRATYERLLDDSGAAALWPEWRSRKIADLVALDIADLGGEATAAEIPQHRFSTAELLGVLYVLEGSSLGARVLVKSVADMDLTPTYGARHMFRQAGDRGAWRSFIAMMEAAPDAPSHDAANATFAAFANAYSQAANRR